MKRGFLNIVKKNLGEHLAIAKHEPLIALLYALAVTIVEVQAQRGQGDSEEVLKTLIPYF